jgi:hypothetical protein
VDAFVSPALVHVRAGLPIRASFRRGIPCSLRTNLKEFHYLERSNLR